jgi:hypothetical protein
LRRQSLWAWRAMLVANLAILTGLFLYKVTSHDPQIEYAHLLMTYHFGFAKRALMGSLISLATASVPISAIYAIGLVAFAVAFVLFRIVFRRIVGIDVENLPLLAFLIGSPFFFKNFMYSIGYFDIYGCIVALIALLIPVGVLYLPVLAVLCVVLVLIHPVQFLLYCPVIGFVAVFRYYCRFGFSTARVLYGGLLCMVLLVVFIASVWFGQVRTSPEALLDYLHGRGPDLTDSKVTYIWTSTLGDELHATWRVFEKNALRIPVYLGLLALHAPVGRYFWQLIRCLAKPRDKAIVVLAVVAITGGYITIGAVVFDYSRWVANWVVCLVLVMLATHLLPLASGKPRPSIVANAEGNLILGWVVTVIPRVGITVPF